MAMSRKDVVILLFLSALWGGSFLFMSIAAPALGPILLIELRVLIAGLALLGYTSFTGKLSGLREHWRQYLVIGAINSALPFVLISTAELHLPASLAATLNATTPLFGAVVAALWIGEALTVKKIGGLLCGFMGVVVLVGLGPLPINRSILWSIGASLLAALSYGVAAVYIKVKVHGGQPQALAAYSQLFAALILLPLVPFSLPKAFPSNLVIVSVLALALLCTALAYLLFFHLIFSVGPTKTIMVTYLAPAFGMLWGSLFLKETLGIGNVIGFGLILISLVLVTGKAQRTGGNLAIGTAK
jgi:drug/metabolite transporter (DMT)-like permease